jgi:exodeoxyribonuclease VII small subunit
MAGRRSDRSGESDADKLTYEQAVEALESIIAQIEEGSIGLEESIAAYRRGTALIRRCKALLSHAEQEIETIESADAARDVSGDGDEKR